MKCNGLTFVIEFDLDDILHAALIDPQPRFMAVGLDDELEALAQLRSTFLDRPASRDGPGYLLDPRDILAVGPRLDDGMVDLFHGAHHFNARGRRRQSNLAHVAFSRTVENIKLS